MGGANMTLQDFLQNIQNKFEDRQYSSFRDFIQDILAEFNIKELVFARTGLNLKGNVAKININVEIGRNSNIVLMNLKVVFKDSRCKEVEEITLHRNPYQLNTYEELVELVAKLKEEYKDKYQSIANEYLDLAKSMNLSKDDAIKLGEAFYRLNGNARDVLLSMKDNKEE